MKNKKLIKIISGTIILLMVSTVGVFYFSNNQVESATYKVKVGKKTVYVRTSHGSAYAKAKAKRAFSSGRLMSGCRNVSYKCHWCRGGGGGGGGGNPRTVDVCPNIPGNQSRVPDNYQKINGQCLPDMCLNITGFQIEVPDGFQDVGGKICQLGSNFYLSCGVQDNTVRTGEEAVFSATPFNHQGLVTFNWYLGSNNSGTPLTTQRSEDRVFFRRTFNQEGNQRLTVVATDANGERRQKYCGVMISNRDDSQITEDMDLNDDGLIDLYAGGGLIDEDAAVNLSVDRTLTNSTCTITWSSTSVNECFLTNTEGLNEKIELNGTRSVRPGTYSVRCFTPGLRVINSDPIVCRLNPDVREI